MKTWTFTFEGSLSSLVSRKEGGTSIRGQVEVRAAGVDSALAKFYLVFTNAPVVRITSIVEGEN